MRRDRDTCRRAYHHGADADLLLLLGLHEEGRLIGPQQTNA